MNGPPPELGDLEGRFLYLDRGWVVVDKPAGIPSTGLTLDDPRCVQYWLMRRFDAMVWAVHQLDSDTSGINIFVREKPLVAAVKRRMEAASGVKSYLAICHGEPHFDDTEIDAPIGFVDEGERYLGISPAGRPARTHVTVLERSGEFFAADVRLFTGRTHQIRIHLAHLGHPLVGEAWYRDPPCRLAERQALHAAAVTFTDGLEPAAFHAPLPSDMRDLARQLGLNSLA